MIAKQSLRTGRFPDEQCGTVWNSVEQCGTVWNSVEWHGMGVP